MHDDLQRRRRARAIATLLGASSISVIGAAIAAQSTACQLMNDALPAGCTQPNGDLVVSMPVGEQASEIVAQPAEGFSVRINGDNIVGDAAVENIARQVDTTLAGADVQVVFDGLGASPRLDIEIAGEPQTHAAGDIVTLQSSLNYPAYVARGEVRILDLGAAQRTLNIIPIEPNGQTRVTVPEGEDIYVVHRVYDANGRYDETQPIPLTRADTRARISNVEDGANTIARKRIPVHGGAITVSGQNTRSGSVVRTLGETIQPDPTGRFVIQRIVPAGNYDVNVSISNRAGQASLNETRRVTVPKSDWFYAGIADLTYGTREDRATGERSSFNSGRFALYVDGRTDTGLQITGSLDTNEGPLDEIFRGLDEKDPNALLDRLDPNDLYPTYGDDSSIVDNTPTDGKIYLRAEQQGNFALWGNFDAALGGNAYVRNERRLYGLQGHFATQDTRSNGEAIATVDLYAAQPDRLPQRDTFRGTGGSVYFLERQDISVASETITVQLRDPMNGRILRSTKLIAGVDYNINYIQGIITLARPLQASIVDDKLIRDTTADANVQLLAQYEYTPTASDVDGYSYGARTDTWITDNLRVGVSGLVEDNGIDEQKLVGADLRFQANENTFLQLDYAKSEGLGFGSTYSVDGGLIVDTRPANAGSGTAVKIEGQADYSDLGISSDGQISGYFETRDEGFSNLDFSVDATTGNEELWGLSIAGQTNDRLGYEASVDVYENTAGSIENTASLDLTYQANDRLNVEVGVSALDRANSTETGQRSELGAKLTYAVDDNAAIYVYGQKSFAVDGLAENDRLGVGGSYVWGNGWSLEADISDGDQGAAARLLANYDDGLGNSYYAGYELSSDRNLGGVSLSGRDQGQFVVGGERTISDGVRVFGENTYDAFGRHRTLTSAYGLNYATNDMTQYSVAFETGQINDGADYAFERYALSLGASYQDQLMDLSGRLEYRTEDGTLGGIAVAADTFLVASNLSYKLDDEARIIASLEYAETDTDQGSLLNGEFGEVVLGYALRPVLDDRLNVLARYRYVHDMYGQRVDGVDENGPRQRSHVASLNATYDLNEHWSIAGKMGYRSAETSPDETSAFSKNDAYLVAGSLTYHLVHEWDVMVEVRNFTTIQAGTSENSVLAAGYRHFGNNLKVGVGYNFGSFSDDLTDLVQDDKGIFLNFIAKF
jgi:hypothetical protein